MKTLDKLHRKNVQLEQDNKKLARESEKASKKGKSGLDDMIVRAAKAATGFLSVSAAIRLVNAELRSKIELDKRAAGTAMDVAPAQAAVIKNLGKDSDANKLAFLAAITKVQKESGFQSRIPLLMAASSTLSATAGNQKLTTDIVRAASPVMKDDQENLPIFAGAMAAVMKASGSTDAKSTAALMFAIQGQARFTELGGFKSAAPALTAATIADTSDNKMRALKQGGALFAGVGSRIEDADAAMTKTAVSNLVSRLAVLVPEKQTTFERMAVVRGDKKLQDELTKAGFKSNIQLVIKELVSGTDNEVAKSVDKAFLAMQSSSADYDAMSRQLKALTPQLGTTNVAQASAGIAENLRLANPEGATASEVRDATAKVLKDSGAGFTRRSIEWANNLAVWQEWGTASPQRWAEHGIDRLRSRQLSLLGMRGGRYLDSEGEMEEYIMRGSDADVGTWGITNKDITQARLVQEEINILKEIRDKAPLDPNRHVE
ncbi:MAG: hypothetical protein GY838_03915 [bacterium]|nr:hypothetical protein [bacterium]